MRNELEHFISAFELAQARDGQAELADFLPGQDNRLYRTVLAELIRIDLEYGWGRGRPKSLEHYLRQFPHLTQDVEVWQQIVFEEYRLRLQAGENTSREEYRRRFGSLVDAWPDLGTNGQPPGSESAKSRAGRFLPPPFPPSASGEGRVGVVDTRVLTVQSLEKAAHSFAESQRNGKSEDLDCWRASFPGNQEHAKLFQEMHGREPAAADRLARTLLTMPEVGSDFLNFHLVAELGRGAFGRVFLAQQRDLAGRFVALKISTNLFSESQTLAQLQHTNIVPIYSAHRADPFQAVCMPYLGSTTLADLLQSFHHGNSLPVSGKDLVSTLNQRKNSTRTGNSHPPGTGTATLSLAISPSHQGQANCSPSPNGLATCLPNGDQEKQGNALKRIEGLTYVQAVMWIGARLADGLAHAHEHHIIHRDLKPANVLLADDGQPLLLDFNISENLSLRSSALGASVGGTLPYMAPEQLEFFSNRDKRVDGRSDLYSLGLILYELLTGKPTFPFYQGPLPEVLPVMIADRKKPPPSVRQWSKAISPAVESIIRHCLEPDPAHRYQSARELQEDLERQLENRPLRFAPEPSLRERTQKWARRHPRLTSSSSVALLALALIGTLAASLVIHGNRLARFQALDNLSQFREPMHNAQFLLYGRAADREKLDQGIDQCRQALDRYQVLNNPDWKQLPEIRNLPLPDRAELQEEIGEMLFLTARAKFSLAASQSDEARQKEIALALNLSQAAETCYDSGNVPRALWQQQAEMLQRQGDTGAAAVLFQKAEATPLQTARDFYLIAHLYAVQGNFRQALPLLEEAVQRDPQNFSAWFVQGNCHDSLMQNGEAIACYSTCIALRPKFHWAWFNRGLVNLRFNNFQRAVDDFNQTIALQPNLPDTHLNRAMALDCLGRYAEAIQDLSKALELGSPRTQVYFLRAALRERVQDRVGAQSDWEMGMRLRPADEQSWVARGLARLPRDPKGALADFDEALKLNAQSFPALQNKAHVLADCLKDDRRAVQTLDKVVELFPRNAMGRAGRGVSLARLGERTRALADAEEALLLDARPPNLYQVGCIHALTSRQNPQDRLRAFELLAYGLNGGFGLDIVDTDSDVDPVRQTPEFRRLVAAARETLASRANKKD